MNFSECTVDISQAMLIENHAAYHRMKVILIVQGSGVAVETGDKSVVKWKAPSPSLNNSNALEECESLTIRSRGLPHLKVCHIFASILKNKVGSSVGSSLKLLVKICC